MARYDLHLSEEDFWALSFRKLDSLIKRHEYRVEHDEYLQAQIAQAVVNFSMCRPEEPPKVTDFMPSMRDRQTEKPVRMTKKRRQLINAKLRALMQLQMRNSNA